MPSHAAPAMHITPAWTSNMPLSPAERPGKRRSAVALQLREIAYRSGGWQRPLRQRIPQHFGAFATGIGTK